MKRTAVLNVVGLTRRLIGVDTPFLSRLVKQSRVAAIGHVWPAVTCSVQSTYLTGKWPSEHGIVGNGWYFRDECEVRFWRQSNKLVQAPKVWEIARGRDPSFTCANLFWWYNMYSSADFTITPRPMYPADGRKIPDVYTYPDNLRNLQTTLGTFPLFKFWGPMADITSSQWIAEAAMEVERQHSPTLNLVYLPHLDYCLQKFGPGHAQTRRELKAIDALVERLWTFFDARHVQVIILSEYGICPVNRPVHLNRVLRRAGLLKVREELGREQLDAGASDAFAVADHQIAHIYINNPSKRAQVRELVGFAEGVAEVLDEVGKRKYHLDHPRSGDLVALAAPPAWFTYYYWFDDGRAPDYARTVDIHRKPGYDPAELFVDPVLRFPAGTIALKLLQRKLGFRTLLDVIPLEARLVQGSHGVLPGTPEDGPLLLTGREDLLSTESIEPTDVCGLILSHIFT